MIITSSGGGGLLQAALAKEQEAKEEDPHLIVVKKDMLKDWIWKGLGKFCIQYWNGAQRRGRVKAQVFAMQMQIVFDWFSWPNVFYKTLKTLYQENVDRVIDTQNMGTSAILKAIRIFNRHKKKSVILEKIVVDLPSKAAIHYFRSIKSLSRKDKRLLRLKTIAPLLEEGQSAEEFWQTHCGLSESEIQYEDLNVRQSFRSLRGKARGNEPLQLPFAFQSSEEWEWMRLCLERGPVHYSVHGHSVECSIPAQDRVVTILLGSQPSVEATFNYVKACLKLVRERPRARPVHLFVFCAEHRVGKDSLLKKIATFMQEIAHWPKNFSVIPFSFQSDTTIAPLFHRSDLTVTRSGGQTAMELMAVNSGEIWIHSEAKKGKEDLTFEELLAGIPGWEGASALYLQKLRGAKLATPELFEEMAALVI